MAQAFFIMSSSSPPNGRFNPDFGHIAVICVVFLAIRYNFAIANDFNQIRYTDIANFTYICKDCCLILGIGQRLIKNKITNMKKILFCIALAMTAIACDTEPNAAVPVAPKPDMLQYETDAPVFTPEGGTKKIIFSSTKPWTARIICNKNASGVEQWCSIDKTSGEGGEGEAGITELNITATPNATYYDRTATLTVKAGNLSKTATITQKQVDVINVAQKQYNVSAEGETITVEIMSNVLYTLHINSQLDWIKKVDNSNRAYAKSVLFFQIEPNTGAEREGVIELGYNDMREYITIIQAGAEDSTDSSEQE